MFGAAAELVLQGWNGSAGQVVERGGAARRCMGRSHLVILKREYLQLIVSGRKGGGMPADADSAGTVRAGGLRGQVAVEGILRSDSS